MKSHSIIKLFLGAIAILAASCSQDDALIDSQVDDNLETYTMYLDADVPGFDTEYEGETRASGNSWEDGDVIYIAFPNEGNTKVGNATYKSSIGAFQFAMTSLNEISDAYCRVYYFRGATYSVSSTTVSLDKYTAIFADAWATYTCSNNIITLSANLRPCTWRLCFKGTSGTQVKMNSSCIRYYTSFNLLSGSLTSKSDFANLQVQDDGYTYYIYGVFTNSSNIINIEVGDTNYTRILESTKLADGESGYLTIPNTSNLYGWTKELIGIINGHEYVDLGLPSGTLWATKNVGATTLEDYGGYYAWGETEEKDYYDWSTYMYCEGTEETCRHIGDDIAGTEYDVAHVKWGGDWQMPSYNRFEELYQCCSKTWITMNGVEGRLLIGPNGNSLFLPVAGFLSKDELYDGSSEDYPRGYYWSSSIPVDIEGRANCLYFYLLDWWSHIYHPRCDGLTVRAIANPENEPKSNCPDENHPHLIDLGQAGKWACCNIGATKPEEYGGYYAWGETEEKDYYDWSTYTCSYYYDISSTEYDVAHLKWGGSWHMPSYSEFGNLINNCTHEWTTQNGIKGVLVTGSNGNKIFLPAAGGRENASLSGVGSWGSYWSSTPDEEYSQLSYDLFINSESFGWSYDGGQYKGQSVRAVGR